MNLLSSRNSGIWIFSAGHFILALVSKFLFGASIYAHPSYNNWAVMWQVLEPELLRFNLLDSLLHLHSQPPLFNLFCGVLVKSFPELHLEVFHWVNILLSSLLVGMSWKVAAYFFQNRLIAFLLGLFFATHPALQLYSAFPMYDVLTAFLCMASVFCLVMQNETDGKNEWFLGFITAVNVLVLTRSAFHLILVFFALCIILAEHKRVSRKMIACALLVSSLSLGWYSKNYIQYGFFGASSWFGMNLYRAASSYYSVFPAVSLEQAKELGVIDQIVLDKPVFSLPSEYADKGFARSPSSISESGDDFNNINVIDISKLYRDNAFSLIAHAPLGYLRAALLGFSRFWIPSYEYPDIQFNRSSVEALISLHNLLQVSALQKFHIGPYRLNSVFVILFPLALLFPVLCRLRTGSWPGNTMSATVSHHLPMLWVSLLVIYAVLIFNLCEFGENQRFKFTVEFPLTIFVLYSLAASLRLLVAKKG